MNSGTVRIATVCLADCHVGSPLVLGALWDDTHIGLSVCTTPLTLVIRGENRMSDERPAWTVYLSGEIHSDWRNEIATGVAAGSLPVQLTAPVTDHAASDDCGVRILGAQDQPFWKDQLGAGVNAIRTRTLIQQAQVVVVRFGPRYRQWNAAFDAGFAAALGKPLITLHDQDLDHALKEVDAAASATARTPAQVVSILQYVIEQR